jgi:polysaccharide export outer membrane protein
MRFKLQIFAALLALVALGGCASNRLDYEGSTALIPYTDEEIRLHEEAKDASYTMRVGDVFGVVFKYEPDLNERNVIILPDGKISFAGVEGFPVAGLTVEELDAGLTEIFARDYEHPELSIVVESLSGNQVYVLGEVNKPGMVKLPTNGTGVLQAIAMAGGMSKDAAESETVVIRLTDQGYQYRRCDIDHLEKGGAAAAALMDLQPFDVIYVPQGAMGDLADFNRTVLSSILNVSRLYWEFYAVANLDKVDRILR